VQPSVPAPPAGALVLARSERLERRTQRLLAVLVPVQIVVVVLVAIQAAYAGWTVGGGLAIVAAVVVAIAAGSLVFAIRWRSIERRMRGMQLWLAPKSVSYTCAEGTFTAPWSAVRAVAVRGQPGAPGRRAQALYLDVESWGGPLSAFGKVARLRLPLEDSGADLAAVAEAVTQHSGGRLSLRQ
jgi:hypothetical protein